MGDLNVPAGKQFQEEDDFTEERKEWSNKGCHSGNSVKGNSAGKGFPDYQIAQHPVNQIK